MLECPGSGLIFSDIPKITLKNRHLDWFKVKTNQNEAHILKIDKIEFLFEFNVLQKFAQKFLIDDFSDTLKCSITFI
jgi:hypothetical protein